MIVRGRKTTYLLLFIILFLIVIFIVKTWIPYLWNPLSEILSPVKSFLFGRKTVEEVITDIRPKLHPKIKVMFDKSGCRYPPSKITLIGLKQEKSLEVWAYDEEKKWRHIKDYKIIAASGGSGPKLKEGDAQVPEGIYLITGLNPNSQFHLSMKLNYPNDFDRKMAGSEGRTDLGGDIFIHGSFGSIGCLAMGDEAIEELFLLVYDAGLENVRVLLTPFDMRTPSYTSNTPKDSPKWLARLYGQIWKELTDFER